ncbi:hypothetical protein ACELLULO517_18295 [Acidisoma cellulosilytica]|uniref:Uncharacterized protein n=1 Tax=Acidisoma cellulosilyticum TaxID=2802395 RepID=A0A963Z5H1_9PROT|nr:hypothetical protein [Acidisoma cellulosilyticum]MCB8882203.1 hypothetical protein [Acidisoma cellulosilyticum]
MDLRAILQIVLPRKRAILFAGLVFALLAFFLSEMMPIRYGSTGLLMLDAPKDQATETMTRMTDIDVLLSPSLLADVATLPALYRSQDLVPALRLPWALMGQLPATLFGYKTGISLGGSGDSGSSLGPRSRGGASSHIDGIVGYLRANLKVTGDADSRVIAIRLAAGNAGLAAMVVNDLMARYIATDYEARRTAITAPQAWLKAQAAAAAQDAAAADAAVLAFRHGHGVFASAQGSYADITLSREWDLLSAAKQQLSEAELSQNLIKSGFDDASALSPQVQSLREHLIEMSQRLAAVQASAGAANIDQQALQNQIQTLRRQMAVASGKALGSVGERVAVAQARVDALQAEVDKAGVAAAGVAENQFQLQQLLTSAQNKHAIYDNVLARLHDVELAASQLNRAQIVSPATVALHPEATRTALCVILGFVMGCILAMTFFVQRQLFKALIGSVDDLTDLLRVPNLGCLPIIGSRRGTLARLALDHPHGAIAETLRGIRLRLQDSAPGPGGSVILVTSAERGEGKTSVAAAVALRAAGDSLRVLLIEGDLHRPSLAEDLKMGKGLHGLEAAVSGKLHRESFLEIHAETKLHCLFARGAAPNAITFLDSRGFRRLVEDARSVYDLVVIDGPPLLRVPDPLVLSRLADRIIWVVRAERTPQRIIVEALKRLPADRRALVATIITGAPKRLLTGMGFYAGYSGRRPLPALPDRSDTAWSETGPR